MIENVPLGRDHRLKKHASALVEAGFEVTVICPRDPSNAKVPDVRVLDYKPPREGTSKWGFVWEYAYSLVVAALLLARAFVTRGFDVIQMSSTPDIYFFVTAPFRLLGKKVVFDWKDPSPELYQARYGEGGMVLQALRRLERASFGVAHRTLVVNESLRVFAMTRGGVAEQDVTIVGNGPILARTRPRPPRPELRRGFEHLVCLLGMMGPQDKIDLAIEAIDLLVHERDRKDCAFTFVGVGDFVPEAKAMVEQRGLSEWVTFPGWVEEDLAFTYLSTADVGIEPNLEEFVSPVKAMEYMAFGLPFVAFDVGETRRLADGAGVYAKPGDVADFARLLDDLLNDSDKRQQMGQIGKHRVENAIAWDHQKTAYLDVYDQLLLDRRSR